jgi:adenosylcobinamide-GDP ribazoletransferase
LAGVIVGVLAANAAILALWIGLSPWIAAGLTLTVQIVVTGAMHEDGLADCADGFWGGWTVDERLEIMRDSRIGTYGVIALVLSLLFRWSLIHGLVAGGYLFGPLVAIAALSRVPMVALMYWLHPSRPHGLSHSTGRTNADVVILASATALLIAVFFAGFVAIPLAVITAVFAWLVAKVALAKIGGQTGDVLGASQQLTEIALLAGFSVILL